MEAALLVILASAAFATSGPAARVALEGAAPVAVAGLRCAVAAAALLLVAGWRLPSVPARDLARAAGAGAILAAHFALFTAGLGATSFTSAVTLVSLEPAVVLLAGLFFFGLRPTRRELAGVAVAALGAFWIASGGEGAGDHSLTKNTIIITTIKLYGLYYAASRALRERLPALVYAAIVYASAAAFLAAGAAIFDVSLRVEGARTIGAIALLGLVPTLGGHTMIQIAARRLPPSVVALVSPGETVGSVLVGSLVFGWWPAPSELIGAAAVLAGATITIFGAGHEDARSAVPGAGGEP